MVLSQRVLSTQIEIRGVQRPLHELLLDTDTFLRHHNLILNTLLDSLPLAVRYKLKLFDTENRIAVKHNIVSALMHA